MLVECSGDSWGAFLEACGALLESCGALSWRIAERSESSWSAPQARGAVAWRLMPVERLGGLWRALKARQAHWRRQ